MSKEKDKIMLSITDSIAQFSKDPVTKVGAIATDDNYRILAVGYNGFPAKYPDDYEGISKEEKLAITIHAEVNCVINAARNGISLNGATLYCNEHCCSNCAAAIINAGIKKVVVREKTNLNLSRWGDSLSRANNLFNICKVTVKKI